MSTNEAGISTTAVSLVSIYLDYPVLRWACFALGLRVCSRRPRKCLFSLMFLRSLYNMRRYLALGLLALFTFSLCPITNFAQETPAAATATEPAPAAAEAAPAEEKPAPTIDERIAAIEAQNANFKVNMDTGWVIITAMLVFFMNLGFATVESGMCRAKNCVNILSKNFIVFAVCSLCYWIVGWGLMFGDSGTDPNAGQQYVGTQGLFFVSGADNSPATGADYKGVYGSINWATVPLWAKFFFQLVFTGTAATIVSGAVAERIKYHSFIFFSAAMAIVIYPVVGHWVWGGGWLQDMGFADFAGSTQVHSVGGWAALTGAIILGPRIGKYAKDGRVLGLPGHSMMAATIGCLILWFGWFGFNPGSTMCLDAVPIADIAVTTNTAAALATLTATATAWAILGKPDIGMTLNGCLAGLVAVTAPCAFITVQDSAIIGAIAGVLVVLGVIGFDKLKVDDPVGATSVHLINGVFGTLCVGIFSKPDLLHGRTLNDALKGRGGILYTGNPDQLIVQAIGVVSVAAYVLVVSSIIWLILKNTIGIRVSQEEEIEGLDLGEHGNVAYHGFTMESPSH
jgi:Amt family ammonium transporter